MSKSFEQLGCSKINIGLAITGKREDGYHDIDSIFQSIRLSDSIYFAKHHSVVFSGGAPELPEYMQKLVTYGEENLALKALRAVQEYTGCKAGAAIHLLKRVPIQAGLGGGSADAAAMLVGLNRFWDLRLTQEELLQIGATLGSDVPFLLQGGTARGTGRGEILTELPEAPELLLVLAKPKLEVATGWVYGNFRQQKVNQRPDIDGIIKALEQSATGLLLESCGNVLESVTIPAHPVMAEIKQKMLAAGATCALMSGSGPTVFAVAEKKEITERILTELSELDLETAVTTTVQKERI